MAKKLRTENHEGVVYPTEHTAPQTGAHFLQAVLGSLSPPPWVSVGQASPSIQSYKLALPPLRTNCCLVTQSCPTLTPCNAARQSSLSFTISQSLLKLVSIESVVPSNRLILCCPLLLLPSVFPSIRIFTSESVLCMRWPKYCSFSFSISPSNEYSGLISFRINLFNLLAVQGTLKSLLQHHSSETSILWHSAFFMVQFSQLGTQNLQWPPGVRGVETGCCQALLYSQPCVCSEVSGAELSDSHRNHGDLC